MKIILAVEDGAGRSSLLIADDGVVYTLTEVFDLVKKGQVSGLQVATRNGVSYLRASRKRVGIPALQDISISTKSVLSAGNVSNIFARRQLRPYWDFYQNQLEKQAAQGKLVVSVDGQPFDTIDHVQSALLSYKEHIFSAARMFHIDPYLLAAILVDETIRLAPFEEIAEKIKSTSIPSSNVSVGIAQVKLQTAKDLIRQGYYNPNPLDEKLSTKAITTTSLSHLYSYVADPKHNVYFAAAKVKALIDEWKLKAGIEIPPVIIATLYHLTYKPPRTNPETNARGEQIIAEFYPLAKEVLGTP